MLFEGRAHRVARDLKAIIEVDGAAQDAFGRGDVEWLAQTLRQRGSPEIQRLKLGLLRRLVACQLEPSVIQSSSQSDSRKSGGLANASLARLYGVPGGDRMRTGPLNDADAAVEGDSSSAPVEMGTPRSDGPQRKRRSAMRDAVSSKRSRGDADTPRFKPEVSHSVMKLQEIGGIDRVKSDIYSLVVQPLRHPEVYRSLGIRPPTGVLLHGPPGCGKTLLAAALGAACGVPFFKITAPEIVSGVSGDSEATLRSLFDAVMEHEPSLLVIDELDVLCPKRELAGKEMERRIVAQLGTCLDSLEGHFVIIVGTTNRPEAIDAMLRRCGRFDREIGIGIPTAAERVRILRSMSLSTKLSEDVDFDELARLTPGHLGADLQSVWAEAGQTTVTRFFANRIEELSAYGNGDAEEAVAIDGSELAGLAVNMEDLRSGVRRVQPSSMREGFATAPDVSWDDVGALAEQKLELRQRICDAIRDKPLYDALGLDVPGGVLLYGPPGCGKTLLAKAVANESGANFISVKGPELLNKYVGESEKAVRQLFARAKLSSPCIVFFDELDALCPVRGSGGGSQVTDRVVNQLLTELDGVSDRKGVYVVAATNRPELIDPAILRSGRIERRVSVPPPSVASRREILRTLTASAPLRDDVDLQDVAHQTERYTGADLAAVVRNAKMKALERYRVTRAGAPLDPPSLTHPTPPSPSDVTFKDADVNTVTPDVVVGAEDFFSALADTPPSLPVVDMPVL
eukprot:Polyplicarium_translucidae@DN1676_c0_g1_i1.p1